MGRIPTFETNKKGVSCSAGALVAAVFPMNSDLIGIQGIGDKTDKALGASLEQMYNQLILPNSFMLANDGSFTFDKKQLRRLALQVEQVLDDPFMTPPEYRLHRRVWCLLNLQIQGTPTNNRIFLSAENSSVCDSYVAAWSITDLTDCILDKFRDYQQISPELNEVQDVAFALLKSASRAYAHGLKNILEKYQVQNSRMAEQFSWFLQSLEIATNADTTSNRHELVQDLIRLTQVAKDVARSVMIAGFHLPRANAAQLSNSRFETIRDQALALQLLAQ